MSQYLARLKSGKNHAREPGTFLIDVEYGPTRSASGPSRKAVLSP
jgi:hypothetical protein